MSRSSVDLRRRRFLTRSTAVVGGVGCVCAAIPFVSAWQPSAKAQTAGAPVTVKINKLDPGQMIRVAWRGKPIWVVRRTQAMLSTLEGLSEQLVDPQSLEPQQPDWARNTYRSRRPEIFVAVGLCTHLGCSPTYIADDFSAQVSGVDAGFFCPCHGSPFDMAGRVFKHVPASLNLVIPPYYFADEQTLVIGKEEA